MKKRLFRMVGRLLFVMIPLFLLLGGIYSLDTLNHELKAETKSSSIYSLGDKVNIGNITTTYIGEDNDYIHLLADDVVTVNPTSTIGKDETLMTWDRALYFLDQDGNTNGVVKTIDMKRLIGVSTIKFPSTKDLESVTQGDYLLDIIPKASEYWFLADTDLLKHNRVKYVTKDNDFKGTNTILEYTPAIDGMCQAPVSKTEEGVLLRRKETKYGERISWISKIKGVKLRLSGFKAENGTSDLKFRAYTGLNCSVTSTAELLFGQSATTIYEPTFDFNYSGPGGTKTYNLTTAVAHVPFFLYLDDPQVVTAKRWNHNTQLGRGDYVDVTFKSGKNTCYNFVGTDPTGDFKVTNGSNAYKSVRFTVGGTMRYTISDSPEIVKDSKTCPNVENNTGFAGIRPIIKIEKEKILYQNNDVPKAKDFTGPTLQPAHEQESKSDEAGPRGNLTLRKDFSLWYSITADLLQKVEGVEGSTLIVKDFEHTSNFYEKSKLYIPFRTSSSVSGTGFDSYNMDQRIEVHAKDINGNDVIGIVRDEIRRMEMKGTDSTSKEYVYPVDITNLIKPGQKKLDLTFYVTYTPKEGSPYTTSYRSEPYHVTVLHKEVQNLSFDSANNYDMEYGQTYTLQANISDTEHQSSKDLMFTVPANAVGKYEILEQQYDRTAGIATAKIKPLTGSGAYPIEISKEGDEGFFPATKATQTIRLSKKPVTISPTLITGKVVGDAMPSLSSNAIGLVGMDAIPDGKLIPVLEKEQDYYVSHPDEDGDGIIEHDGTWKLVYPGNAATGLGEFANKYSITLQGWTEATPEYVFQVDADGIMDDWIEITPAPNENGWNNTSITVQPSDAGKVRGYYQIAKVIAGQESFDAKSKLVYSEETSGMTPSVVLQKKDEYSVPKTLRHMKIDTSLPRISTSFPQGWQTSEQTLTIDAFDTVSGISDDGVAVLYNGSPVTVQKTDANRFEATISENGTYTVTASDRAGNAITKEVQISNMDMVEPVLNVTAGTLAEDQLSQELLIDTVVGPSGLASLTLYHKGDGEIEYTLLEHLNIHERTLCYQAEFNGAFKVEMKTELGQTLTKEITLNDIDQENPVVGITATLTSNHDRYYENTWTNQDVNLQLRNINSNFIKDVTFQYRKASEELWIDLEKDMLTITTKDTKWLDTIYEFRAVSGEHASAVKAFHVKLEQDIVESPTVLQADQFTKDTWFHEQVQVQAKVKDKASRIAQMLWYSLDQGATWICLQEKTMVAFDQAGEHTIMFKSVDEAGNESNPTPIYYINIKEKEKQEILIEEEYVKQATYGTDFTIHAKVKDPAKQSDASMIFTVSDPSKAVITSYDYDHASGMGSADIHLLNGDHYLDIIVQKAGDEAYADATETITIQLLKKDVTIHPEIIHGKRLQDHMPEFNSLGTGLVNHDLIPAELRPELIPIASTTAQSPDLDHDGIIDETGTWKMVYPTDVCDYIPDFMKKYNVTLQEYDQVDSPYVFIVTADGIVDGWLQVTPDANGEGWNKDNVTVSLSDDAKTIYQGIALIENATETQYGESITFTDETSGITPTFVLKGDGMQSDPKSIRTIRIDKTPPTMTYTVDQALIWTDHAKTVTLRIQDQLSGIKEIRGKQPDGTAIALNPQGPDIYTFTAETNGDYEFVSTDAAGNDLAETVSVSHIDPVAPTLEVSVGALSPEESYRELSITQQVGISGASEFAVYYKEQLTDAYDTTPLSHLNQALTTQAVRAVKNGYYRIRLIDHAGRMIEKEVQVEGITAILPTVQLQAVVNTSEQSAYTSGTWTNQDILVKVENTNSAIHEPVEFEYREIGEPEWRKIENPDHQVIISEAAWSDRTYEFRGVIGEIQGMGEQLVVRIDKEKPAVPELQNNISFTKENWYGSSVTLTNDITPKTSGITQTLYYTLDDGLNWNQMSGLSHTVSHIGEHVIRYKLIDQAGNESDVSEPAYVNINDGTPEISIRLHKDDVRSFFNAITFNEYFKDYINVSIDTEWYHVPNGSVYYIIDDSETPSTPSIDDVRWIKGTFTRIEENKKVMIYAKAVSGNGKITQAATSGYVIVDSEAPSISFIDAQTNWTKNTTIQVHVEDTIAGIDASSVQFKINHGTATPLTLQNGIGYINGLPDGSYPITVVASDRSGNAQSETTTVHIDTVPPVISGVKDQSVYKQYYVPRFVSVSDPLSDIRSATYQKRGSDVSVDLSDGDEVAIKDIGEYQIFTEDQAGNTGTLTFQLVPLPEMNEITGSDESKEIIDQIQKEFEENKDRLDGTESENYDKWLEDAEQHWEEQRQIMLKHKESGTVVEGIEDTTFDPQIELIVEELPTSLLPALPHQPSVGFHVYLKKQGDFVQPMGKVNVHIPYEGEHPVVYDIGAQRSIATIEVTVANGFISFTTEHLSRYAISELHKPIENPDGSITVPGGDGDITVKPNPDGEKPSIDGDGNIVVPPGGSVVGPDGETQLPDGGIVILPDGTIVPNPPTQPEDPDQPTQNPDGSITVPGGDGDITVKPNPDGEKPSIDGDGNIIVPPGGIVVGPDGETQLPDGGTVILPDGTIVPNPPTQNPDGSITVPGGDGDITVKPNPDGEKPSIDGDGNIVVPPGGSVVGPDGETQLPDGGTVILPDGTIVPNPPQQPEDPDQPTQNPDGSITVPGKDGILNTADDVIAKPGESGSSLTKKPDGTVSIPPKGIVSYPNGTEIKAPDGGILYPDGTLILSDGTTYLPDGTKKEEFVCNLNGKKINIDTDHDGLPDIDLDLDGDCVPDLNIDTNFDKVPDIDIDTNGDGKPDINVDVNHDGKADVNIAVITKWMPDKNCKYQSFTYDTMEGITPYLNIDTSGDGKPDRNVDDDGDGIPDTNVDADWYETYGHLVQKKEITEKQNTGADTGDATKWYVWSLTLVMTLSMMGYRKYIKYRSM